MSLFASPLFVSWSLCLFVSWSLLPSSLLSSSPLLSSTYVKLGLRGSTVDGEVKDQADE